MKKEITFGLIISALILLLPILNCSTETTGTVNINAGSEKRAVTNSTEISSLQVAISGSDMETVTGSFSYGDSISLEVPVGTDREISITAQVVPGSLTAIREYRGSARTDVISGENSVTIPLSVTRSAIVIPDFLNSRLVMIDSMNPSEIEWKTINDGDITSIFTAFKPYDVEMSRNGDIYVINNEGSTDGAWLVRLGRFDNSDTTVICYDNGGYSSLALDETNNQAYISRTGSTIYIAPLSASNLYPPPAEDLGLDISDGNYGTLALTCDPDGNLYVLNPLAPSLSKLDMTQPSGTRLIKKIISIPMTAIDIMFKNGEIWLADTTSSGAVIKVFDTDLNLIDSFGSQTTAYSSPPKVVSLALTKAMDQLNSYLLLGMKLS